MLIQNELIDSSECFKIKSRLLENKMSSSSSFKVKSNTEVFVMRNGLRTKSNFLYLILENNE